MNGVTTYRKKEEQSQLYLNCQTQIEDAILQAFPE
jgi:hypothetical protein